MAAHTHDAAAGPAGHLSVTIRSTVPATESGVLVLARIDAPAVGLPQTFLVLDPQANAITLMAPCGCQVTQDLARLIVDLAHLVAESHGQHAPGPQDPNLSPDLAPALAPVGAVH